MSERFWKDEGPFRDWHEIVNSYENLPKKWDNNCKKAQWIFKGVKKSAWHLQTSLERAIIDFALNKPQPQQCASDSEKYQQTLDEFYNALPQEDKFKKECYWIREFKRKAHHYLSYSPLDNCLMEWLALMRHYGAPTRLLDFTYSFFVALYFAMECTVGRCAVWVFDSGWIQNRCDEIINTNKQLHQKNRKRKEHPRESTWIKDLMEGTEEKERDLRELFLSKRKRNVEAVGTANPYRLNRRLTIQRGVFLYPTNINKSFHDNMNGLAKNSKEDPKKHLRKFNIEVCQTQRNDILRRLNDMNINRATLFPGLQGFAESLRVAFAFPDVIVPPDDEP
jgi:hypothetical protein